MCISTNECQEIGVLEVADLMISQMNKVFYADQ